MSNLPTFTEKRWDYNTKENQTVCQKPCFYDLRNVPRNLEIIDKLRQEEIDNPVHFLVYNIDLYMKECKSINYSKRKTDEDNMSEENQKKIQKTN